MYIINWIIGCSTVMGDKARSVAHGSESCLYEFGPDPLNAACNVHMKLMGFNER
jgi:hypothetical protein